MVNRAMNVIVTEYSKDWPRKFAHEAKKMKDILGDELIEIHHIGSTSVPGLQAKPIIDMMRTMVNVNDSILAGVVSSNAIGQFNKNVLLDPEATVERETM